TSHDPDTSARIKNLREHDSRTKYSYELLGMNSRLDAMQAAILRMKLRHLDGWTRARQANAERYQRLFQEYAIDRYIGLPSTPDDRSHVFNQFVIRSKKRDALRQHLAHSGIPTEIYYPAPLH